MQGMFKKLMVLATALLLSGGALAEKADQWDSISSQTTGGGPETNLTVDVLWTKTTHGNHLKEQNIYVAANYKGAWFFKTPAG